MNAKDVRNLKWIPVTDWDGLTTTHFSKSGRAFVSNEDMENFVTNLFRNIARKLNISSSELLPILMEENEAFYKAKDMLFQRYNFDSSSDELLRLKMLLKIPDIDSVPMVPKVESILNAEKVLEDFSKLSETEKLKVMQRLKLIRVKIEFFD